ncbi:MAG: hypothetical protein K2Q10_02980, partial [Rhodospirillales bacterium]|nr:hypothetical protein [Rhodospirillales bacterium]
MVNSEALQHLMASTVWPAVSIYLPTMAAGQKATSNQTRFGKLVIAAEDRLIQGGLAATEARALMSVSEEPLRREGFWRPQDRGLAVFIGPGVFHIVKLSYDVAEEVVVGRLFHVTPLLSAMAGEDRYHVLAVSANRARLFEGRRHSFRL